MTQTNTPEDTPEAIDPACEAVPINKDTLIAGARDNTRSVIEGQESDQPWSISLTGKPSSGPSITVTIEHKTNDRYFSVHCEPAEYCSKTVGLDSIEDAERVQRALATLSPAACAKLAVALAYTQLDDTRANHPNGVGANMEDTLMELAK